MKKLTLLSATVFGISLITAGFTSAQAECYGNHSKTTAQSSSQQIAQKPLQTPKPSGS